MNIWQAIILGVLQGLTEFLPVSSSGHLVLVQNFLPNFEQSGITFDTILHAGTMLAILIYFRENILSLNKKTLFLLLIGSIPAGLVGVLFASQIEGLFSNIKLVGLALLITAILNYFTDRFEGRREKLNKLDAIFIGIGQALAIIPGVSRSGSTIFVGTSQGIRRKTAAEFSFLLSVPAVTGANVLQFYSHGLDESFQIGVYSVGCIAAFISGILAISAVMRFLTEKKFKYFAAYCVLVGVLTLVL